MKNNDFKELINDCLLSRGLIGTHTELLTHTEEVEYSDDQVDESDIGVSSEGVRYIKSLVAQYLNEKRYPFTQDNIDLVAKMFQANGNGYTSKSVETVVKSDLDDMSDEQMNSYIEAKIAVLLNDLRNDLKLQQLMEYDVDVIKDKSGGVTDIKSLENSISWHSARGWQLKSVFTNELGQKSRSLSYGDISLGKDLTLDQVILIYERPAYMTDDLARKLLSDIKSK